jgi:hypothetical protein
MKTTALFVLLQYVFGFAFATAGAFAFKENSNLDLLGGILFSLLVGYGSMLIGVALVAYFHLRVRHILRKYGLALAVSFLGFVLFLIFYILIENYLPIQSGLLALIFPLTGAVFGFNYVVTRYSE